MSACRTCRLRSLGAVLVVLALAWFISGCRLGSRKVTVLDKRLRPVAAKAEFTDLKGDPLADVVAGLVKLGVLDFAKGQFNPNASMCRGDFVSSLVRANDIFFRDQPDQQIPLAPADEPVLFLDVQPTVPCFPYVQGMVNAGYVVGSGESEFGYNHNLTREWLIVLRNGIDLGRDAVVADPADYNILRVRLRAFLEDADLVGDQCLAAVLADVAGGKTIRLAFAGTRRLDPKKTVTRREAALALSELRGRTYQQALQIEPKWEPLSPEERQALQAQAAKEAEEHGHHHEHGGE